MKRLIALSVVLAAFFFSALPCAAAADNMDDSLDKIRSAVDDETMKRLEDMGYRADSPADVSSVDFSSLTELVAQLFSEGLSAPLASLGVITAVLILSSLLETYTFSLRYAQTKEIMNVVTSLLIVGALIGPIVSLMDDSLSAVRGCADLMLLYVPVMAGIMAFSGRVVGAGGYYAAVMAVSQGVARFSTSVCVPLLHVFLTLSVAAGVSDRVRLKGICEQSAKLAKWFLTFLMTIFSAVISIQGFAAKATDSATSKTVRFALTSFIPMIGSSINEAYKTLSGSMDVLRSGIGIFVILALFVTFLPLIVRIILWQFSLNLAKIIAELLGVNAPQEILSSVSSALSLLTAIMISVLAVFIISSAVLISAGGSV